MTDQTPPKLCVNCKHIGRNSSGDAQRYRCFAPQNVMEKEVDLVTGETVTHFHFNTCYDARAKGVLRRENCGPEGKWFEPAPPKFETQQQITDRAQRLSAVNLLSQLDLMK